MKKPLIGIIPLVDTDKDSLWMLPGYMNCIENAGGIPVMFPLTTNNAVLEQLFECVDGILFTGGQDVYPMLYRQSPTPECGKPCFERDMMEGILLKLAVKHDKPVFGICRGIQFINAALGGELYQDLPTENPSNIEHHQKAPYDTPIHKILIKKDSPLGKLLKKDVLSVNSYHHQAIKLLSPQLEAMAFSEDGLVEAVCHKTAKFIWAVQWHPEYSYKSTTYDMKILKEFIKSTKKLE
ncbi:MAG: gamma-glutamyl-gamma-aminobutyrate hydrolase family protein [Bacteroidales bacterium]|nr:gamma-glutamyl-gamma-aminobutyrate hydrolase family protein [Bacteroidales bacterium]